MARRVAALAVLVVGCAFLFSPPHEPRRYDNDEYIYADTVARMKRGESYYRAAAESYRAVGGKVETARAFRPPTAFLIWRWVPTDLLWPAYVVVVVVGTGLVLTAVTTAPVVVPLIAVYLLTLGRVSVEFLFVELWTVPLAAAMFLAVTHRRWRAAAALALVATAVRELAGGLLLGGLLAAVVRRRPWRPWVAGVVAAGALYALHLVLLHPHLARHGTEERLLGTGSIGAVLDMAGFQLPAHRFVGAVLWLLAVVGITRTGRLPLAAFYLAFPLLGLVANRPYWGAMVVPFFILWAAEAVVSTRRGAARP